VLSLLSGLRASREPSFNAISELLRAWTGELPLRGSRDAGSRTGRPRRKRELWRCPYSKRLQISPRALAFEAQSLFVLLLDPGFERSLFIRRSGGQEALVLAGAELEPAPVSSLSRRLRGRYVTAQ
jgi:hypothetical protein